MGLVDVYPDAFGDRYRRHETSWGCVGCGQPIQQRAGSVGIYITGRASIVHPADVALAEQDPEWMGWWPIGPECVSALPSEWKFQNPDL